MPNHTPNKLSLSKFESMLKTNNVYFFDSTEFESIIHYYFDQGRHSLAKKAIKLGLEQHPTSINLRLLLAESYIYEDKLDKAEVILNQLHALEPNNEEIYINRASVYSKRNMHVEAVNSLKTALVYSDNDADILAMIGMEYLYLDNFNEAREHFAKCLNIDPEDYSSLYNVIYCFDMESKHQEAIRFLLKFIDSDPYSEVAWHQLGRQYFILERYDDALEAFDYAVIIDDVFVGAYLEKAKTLEKLKRYEEAIENYMVTTELDDPTAFAYFRMGKCYISLENVDKALNYFKKTVKEDPLLDKGWLALTELYLDAENYHKALYYINKAIEIDESNTLYWRRYAEINLKLNFFEEVVEAFFKCLEFNDKSIDIYVGLVDVLRFIGEFEEAKNVAIKAMRYFPDFPEVEYRLACLYFILGNQEKGEKILRKALEADYENHIAYEELFPTVFEMEEVVNILAEFKS